MFVAWVGVSGAGVEVMVVPGVIEDVGGGDKGAAGSDDAWLTGSSWFSSMPESLASVDFRGGFSRLKILRRLGLEECRLTRAGCKGIRSTFSFSKSDGR